VDYVKIGKRSQSNNIVALENFLRDFINLVYKYNLKNKNCSTFNAPGIDLVDEYKKIAIQITTQESNKKNKIKDAIIKFNKHYKNCYEKLIILFVTTEKVVGKHVSEAEIWNINKIYEDIEDKQLPEIENIHYFLKREIEFFKQEIYRSNEITSSNLVMLVDPDRLRLENYGQKEIYIFGVKFDAGPANMEDEPRIVPPKHNYYFLSARLQQEAHTRIGSNGEALKNFEMYLKDYVHNEYIARFKLLFVITDGSLIIHSQHTGICQKEWSSMCLN